MTPLEMLRHHVTGAIERGEGEATAEISAASSFTLGQRVQTHPATDAWMQGDRYGTVTKIGREYVHAKLDRSGRTLRFHPVNLGRIA